MTIKRNIPDTARREIEKQESAEIFLIFLKIKHQALSETIRVVSDPENFVLAGEEYQGFEFDISLLTDGEGMPEARLTVQNVDRKIGEAVLNSNDPCKLEIYVIEGSQFDLSVFPRTEIDTGGTEYTYRAKNLMLTQVEGNELSLTGVIRSWDYTQEVWPGLRATQSRFPGLYW